MSDRTRSGIFASRLARVLCAFAPLACASALAQTATEADLAYSFTRGAVSYEQVRLGGQLRLLSAGESLPLVLDIATTTKREVMDVSLSGEAQATLTLSSTLRIVMPGQSISSTRDRDGSATRVNGVEQEPVGEPPKPVRVKLDRRGRITGLEGDGAEMAQQLASASGLLSLPGKTVRVGERWTSEGRIVMPLTDPGAGGPQLAFTTKAESELRGLQREDGRLVATIVTNIDGASEEAFGRQNGTLTMRFDVEAGSVIDTEGNLFVDARLALPNAQKGLSGETRVIGQILLSSSMLVLHSAAASQVAGQGESSPTTPQTTPTAQAEIGSAPSPQAGLVAASAPTNPAPQAAKPPPTASSANLPLSAPAATQPPTVPAQPQTAASPLPALPEPLKAPVRPPRPGAPGENCARLGEPAYTETYCVSSVLPSQGGRNYGPANLFSADKASAWVEGAQGDGRGEWIAIEFDAIRLVKGITINNGLFRNNETYWSNARVKHIKVQFSQGETLDLNILDQPADQTFVLKRPAQAYWLRFQIDDVYPGKRYPDLAIGKLRIASEPVPNAQSSAAPSAGRRKAPSWLQGRWAAVGTQCADPDGVNLLDIAQNGFQAYEHRCEFTEIREDPNRVVARTACRGEGRNWRDEIVFALDGPQLQMSRKSDGRSERSVRCQ